MRLRIICTCTPAAGRGTENSPGFLLLQARLKRRHAILDDEGAQEDRQEPNVLDRLVAHQPSEQEPEDDGKRRLQVSLLELKANNASNAHVERQQ